MKAALITMMGIGLLAGMANANGVEVSSREVTLPVDISRVKVKVSNRGYGETYLVKILVPELADVTLLDHRNEGEGAPCLATYDTKSIDDILQGNPGRENAKFTVTLQRRAVLDSTPGQAVCRVSLLENIEGTIRGRKFVHYREKELGTRHPDDCR